MPRDDASTSDPIGRLQVGRIGRAHGLKGEVAFALISDRTERVAPGSILHTGARALTVSASRPHQGRWLLSFKEIKDRTAAEELLGEFVMADPLDASELEDGENVIWVHELVGAEVRDISGALLGPVVAVEDNPASALMVVSINGDEVLVPVVFIVENSPGVVVINPPDGLLDLGKSS
ncbi:MAG: 16S rRNA processing protein RimM [Actinobacteria bacterium]|uniref:Unannotated protein n=2 Tax=freshwater metagenome TaxID=449393 RepID=A0A6J6W8V3_9ZZZZ|nr:16S rRNA processing protein RimM [Actinomycetota bacterium]